MALIAAGLLLAVFIANVALGSVAGDAPLGVVAEAILLFAASICFTVAILKREAAAKEKGTLKPPPPSQGGL
jgi:hypothetical protein